MRTFNASTTSVEERDYTFYRKYIEFLYDRYSPKIYGFLIKKTNSKEEAEKLLVQIFLKVWDEIKTFTDNEEKRIVSIVFAVLRK